MLKRIYVTNHLGERVECKIDGVEAENESGLIITSIDGLGPVKATINMTEIPSSDGSIYNSSRLSNRNIVLKAVFTNASSIEDSRLLAYRYFPVKKKVKLEIETDTRTGTVEGYVESNEPDIFSKQSSFQVSIICESACFDGEDIDVVDDDVSHVLDGGNFNVDYDGDESNGVIMDFKVADVVETLEIEQLDHTQTSVGKMQLDFTKISGFVPNTSPTNEDSVNVGFLYRPTNQSRPRKFIPAFTHDFAQYDADTDTLDVFTINGTRYIGEITIGRSRYDKETNSWISMPDATIELPEDSELIVHGQPIAHLKHNLQWSVYDVRYETTYILMYLLTGFNTVAGILLYAFDEDNNNWRIISNLKNFSVLPRLDSSKACYINGEVDIIYASSDLGDSNIYQATFTNHGGWTEHGLITTASIEGGTTEPFGSVSDFDWIVFASARYDGLLHMFIPDQGHYTRRYDSAQPSTWNKMIDEGDDMPVEIGSYNVTYCDGWYSVPLLTHPSDPSDPETKVNFYKYFTNSDYRGEFILVQENAVPDGYNQFKTMVGDIAASSDKYYLLSGNILAPSYTEPPNNVKLVEGDELIISTMNGEKYIRLKRGNNYYSVINALNKNVTWSRLEAPFTYLVFVVTNHESPKIPPLSSASLHSTTLYEGM